jgi:hypothetical protein
MKSEFGWIEIKKTRYDYDVVIHTDGSITRRSKKKSKDLKNTFGHTPSQNMNWNFWSPNYPKKSISEPDNMEIYLSHLVQKLCSANLRLSLSRLRKYLTYWKTSGDRISLLSM